MKYWIRHTADESFSEAMSYSFIEGAIFGYSDSYLKNRKLTAGKFIAVRPIQTPDIMNVFDLANLCVKDMRAAGFSKPALLFNFEYYSKNLKFLPHIKQAVKDTVIIVAAKSHLIEASLLFEYGVDYIIFNQFNKEIDMHDDFEDIKKLRDAHYYKTRLIVSASNGEDLVKKINLHPDAVCLTDRRFLELF